MIKAFDEIKSQAFNTCELTVRLQWENAEADMWDDKSDYWAEYDQTDIANAWDVMMIQKCQTWKN